METQLITRIEKKSTYSRRYQIYVNDELQFSVHEDVLVKHRLYKGMPIDPQQIQEILSSEEYGKVRQATLRYLSYKPRTIWEVKQYLAGKDFATEYTEQVIQDFQDQGYLDDRQYARSWVEERRAHKGHGQIRLRQEMLKKGIAEKWIDEALSYTDNDEERQQAMKIAERRYLRIYQDSWPKVERRLGQYLLRQGYSAEIVYPILTIFRSRHEQEKRGDF
ncbi:RecX family transcriptional regulator [Hazenella coriacea]|uniref:RecX family transcriptional regulator n=1 Tax=Hazenella coriacea TaxID=1179467 RepID=UPI00104C4770|nr:RecX family transcriptional regulator [Hazenella coriacea]